MRGQAELCRLQEQYHNLSFCLELMTDIPESTVCREDYQNLKCLLGQTLTILQNRMAQLGDANAGSGGLTYSENGPHRKFF